MKQAPPPPGQRLPKPKANITGGTRPSIANSSFVFIPPAPRPLESYTDFGSIQDASQYKNGQKGKKKAVQNSQDTSTTTKGGKTGKNPVSTKPARGVVHNDESDEEDSQSEKENGKGKGKGRDESSIDEIDDGTEGDDEEDPDEGSRGDSDQYIPFVDDADGHRPLVSHPHGSQSFADVLAIKKTRSNVRPARVCISTLGPFFQLSHIIPVFMPAIAQERMQIQPRRLSQRTIPSSGE